MVGSVLLDRMRAEGDLDGLEIHFFTTSNPGGPSPAGGANDRLRDARQVGELKDFDVVLTCQGGGFTSSAFDRLREGGWSGYWIDAASTLRLRDRSTLILDPVNGDLIRRRLRAGCRDFIGPNCTVSLLLMAMVGLYRAGLVKWISTMTYQAVSGAGARRLTELGHQVRTMGTAVPDGDGASAVDVERAMTGAQRSEHLPTGEIGAPLACSVLPWIDRAVELGQTREEWKASVEASRILGADPPVKIDGTCVRVDALRCHSQALCIRLNRKLPLDEAVDLVRGGNRWVNVIDNTAEVTLERLTPVAVAGRLEIAVGRLRKLQLGPGYLGAFTVGDQLLWGAAEPLRRMLGILRDHCE